MEDFGLKVYNFVVSIIGELPSELQFVYAICTVLVFIVLILMVYLPWMYLFKR